MERCKWQRGVFVFAFSSDRLMLCRSSWSRVLLAIKQTWETVNIYTWAHKSIRPTSIRKEKKTKKIAWPFCLLRKHGINKWCKALARCLLRGSQRPPFVFNLRCPRNVRLIFFQCDGTVEMLALSETCSLWPSPLTWCCFIPPFPPSAFHFLSFLLTKATVLCRTRWHWHKQLPSSWWRENISCRTGAGLIRWNVASLGNFIADN